MRVYRFVCPYCKSEKRKVYDEANLKSYSEEIISKVCDMEECRGRYNSPEQKLLRAIFGEKV